MKKLFTIISVVFLLSPIICRGAENEKDTAEQLAARLAKSQNRSERVDICLEIAGCHTSKGDIKKASEYYRKALAEHPGKKRSYNILLSYGDMYLLEKMYAQAIEAYKQAVELSPRSEDARMKLASAYEQSELVELARQEYEKILKNDPRSFNAHYALASLYLRLNLNSGAMKHFKSAVTLKSDTKVYRQMAVCARNMGESGIAVAMLKRVISLEPEYDDFITLGRLYQADKQVKEADEVFSKAVKHDPGKADAYLFLGILYLENKDFEPAEKMLQIAQEKLPDEALIHFILADIYYRKKDIPAARAEIRLAESLSKGRMMSLYSAKFNKFMSR